MTNIIQALKYENPDKVPINSEFDQDQIKRLARYGLKIKPQLAVEILILLLSTGTYVLQAFMLAGGCSAIFAGSDAMTIFTYYGIAVACIVVRSFLVKVKETYAKQVAGTLKAIMRKEILEKLIALGPQYMNVNRSGRIQSIVTDGIEYMEAYVVDYIPQVFNACCSVIPIVAYIFYLDFRAGIVLTVASALAIAMPHILRSWVRNGCIGYWRGYAILNAQYVDTMQGMTTLKVFNACQDKEKELIADSEHFRREQIKNTTVSLVSTANIILMAAIGVSITSGVAALDVATGRLGSAGMFIILFLAIECMRPISDLNNSYHSSYMGFSVANHFFEIMDLKHGVVDKTDARTDGISDALPGVEFDRVSFFYESNENFAVDDLSFAIEPGKTVAVVGMSGSGKSTLVNLLLRFYECGSGKVKINGIDIRDFSQEYLKQKISVVFQDTFLFYGSVEDNIRIAKPTATQDELEAAAKMANAHTFIVHLPDGYQTKVGERGATLSGGERQRIAIARAILKNAPILVLDEATSSVDAVSEDVITHTINSLDKKYTALIIAHRLSTIRNVNTIIVMDDGHISEVGNHDQLITQNGIYRKLVESQQTGR